jgi:predicted RNase H-like HicB family nuclease
MEQIVNLRIEKLAEGVYLATSDDIQGLLAQGRTITETLEIARYVARILVEEQDRLGTVVTVRPIQDAFDYPLILST